MKRPHQKVPLVLRYMRFVFRYLGPVFPRPLSAWAYRLWFSTRRFKRPPHEQSAWESAERSQIEVQGQSIAVYHWRHDEHNESTPTILLIHGWNGRGTQLAPMIRPLHEAGFSVLALDGPGHGDSDGDSTTVFDVAQALLTLVDRHGPICSAITHSFGLPCLLVASDERPDFEQGLKAVVGISPPSDASGLIDKFAEMLCIPESVLRHFRQRLYAEFGHDVAERLAFYRLAEKMQTPALLIHDAHDHDVPLAEGKHMAESWPGAQFMETQHLGHRRILKDAEVIEKAVSFIQVSCGLEDT